jgi:hypothetical protein
MIIITNSFNKDNIELVLIAAQFDLDILILYTYKEVIKDKTYG